MDLEIEFNPIAITTESYNLHIANLVEHLLYLDARMNANSQSEVA
jgi:hypothetical protein